MIWVKLVGGAKKSFLTDNLQIEKSDISIQDLLNLLLIMKPENTPKLDIHNVLIAVNGIDSSAIEGKMTRIQNNDVVSIIPIIHGGTNRMIFCLSTRLVQIIEIKGKNNVDSSYVDELRKQYPQITIQAISSKFVLNIYHLKNILSLSLYSQKKHSLLSNKIETDILMRFAITSQISEAIISVGIKPKQNFILITLGNKKYLDKLYTDLESFSVELFSKSNANFLKKYFHISTRQLQTNLSKNSLEDLLIEKAAVLL
jgi:tRNA threonylcarbamoyladenosine modification (KEOPS) complex Cgi121 subunit/molybdopterin converting factor small subunit